MFHLPFNWVLTRFQAKKTNRKGTLGTVIDVFYLHKIYIIVFLSHIPSVSPPNKGLVVLNFKLWRLMAPVSSQAMCAGQAGCHCVLDQWVTVGGPVVRVRSLRLSAITASLSRLDHPAKILTTWKHKPSLGTQRGFPPPLFPRYGHFLWPPRAEVCVEDLEPSRSQSDPV